MSEKKAPSVTSRLSNISLLDFKIDDNAYSLKVDVKTIVHIHTVNVKVKTEKKNVEVEYRALLYTDMNKETCLGEIKTLGEFEVLNLDEILEYFKGFPTNILAIFVGTVIATTRGFLLMQAKGTPLEGTLIPMIDSNTFFHKEDSKIESDNK